MSKVTTPIVWEPSVKPSEMRRGKSDTNWHEEWKLERYVHTSEIDVEGDGACCLRTERETRELAADFERDIIEPTPSASLECPSEVPLRISLPPSLPPFLAPFLPGVRLSLLYQAGIIVSCRIDAFGALFLFYFSTHL